MAAAVQIALDSFSPEVPRPSWLLDLADSLFANLTDTERDVLGLHRAVWRTVGA